MPNYRRYHAIIWEESNTVEVYESDSEFSGKVNTLINQGYEQDKDFEVDYAMESCIEDAVKAFKRFYENVIEF